jgi:SNF2 family DNA or RNA helicase
MVAVDFSMRLIPRLWQVPAIDAILHRLRVAVWMEMGMGKTSATLFALALLKLYEDTGKILVIAPKRVARGTWPQEVDKWDDLRHLSVSVCIGSEKERLAALGVDADIYTINRENVPWLVAHFGKKWPFKTVVVDESTMLKGYRSRQGSKRAKALASVNDYITRLIELTGTPSPNGLLDIWGQLWFIDGGERLGRTFISYTSRWFQAIQKGNNPAAKEYKAFDWSQDQIQERIKDVVVSVRARDYFDPKEPITIPVMVDLDARALALYKQMERDLYAVINKSEVEATNAAVKSVKCLQMASGAVYLENGSYEVIHTAKIEALAQLVEEWNGEAILVAYQFKPELEMLLKAFPQGRKIDSEADIDDWNAGKIPIAFIHPASAGHGLNLQYGGRVLVYYSHWWDFEQRAQIAERIGPMRQKQAGLDRDVFIYHLIAKNTIDTVVISRTSTKKSVQECLMEAARGAQDDE